ncbi:MAG: tyrosine-type recombinase/integrase [Micromonosporaceae bacterium]
MGQRSSGARVPGRRAVRGTGRPTQAGPAGRLCNPRCRTGGTWPAGQPGRQGLDPWTLQVLAAHRDRQPPAAWDGYVFARPGGGPYTPGYLTRRFARLVRREGLPPIRLHDLRHGAATLALAGGADLKVIRAMLGHASIILTADTDTSVLPDLARATADAVAAQILKAARTPRPHPGPTRPRHDRHRSA